MNISYILCLFLAVFSSACDDDKTDENNAENQYNQYRGRAAL